MKAQEIKEIHEKIGLLLESNRRIEALLQNIKPMLVRIMEGNDYILSTTEAAKYTSLSPPTIRKLIKDGKLKRVERNGKIGILKSDLDKYFYID